MPSAVAPQSSEESPIVAGLPVTQENGQRKWGPPSDWDAPLPPRGCEVFVGKLPRSVGEESLIEIFSRVGTIYELRLMVDFSGSNRGYCFVTYSAPSEAHRACEELNNYEIRTGQHIGVVMSVDNCRLFVGGIPRERKREEVMAEMKKLTEGVRNVILYPSANDKSKNRGFAFVEYTSHKGAAMARKKLSPGKIQLWGQSICVDWAEPEQEVDDDTMSQVKILYVRNLMMTTTEERIRAHFEQFKEESVERVKKIKDFAFVHFFDRTDALHAMSLLDGKTLDGAELEVVLAKPPDRSLMRFVKNVQKQGQAPIPWSGNVHRNIVAEATRQYTQTGTGLRTGVENMHGSGLAQDSLAWAYTGTPLFDSSLALQPFLAGDELAGNARNAMGVRHVSSKMGGRGAAGMRGAGFQAFVNSQLRKNRRRGSENSFILEHPGGSPALQPSSPGVYWVAMPAPPSPLIPHPSLPLGFFPTHPILSPLPTQHKPPRATQQLEEICRRNPNLGSPHYETGAVGTKDSSGKDILLYVGKVVVPGLRDRTGFQGEVTGMDEDEAKELAAIAALTQLGLPSPPLSHPSPPLPSPTEAGRVNGLAHHVQLSVGVQPEWA